MAWTLNKVNIIIYYIENHAFVKVLQIDNNFYNKLIIKLIIKSNKKINLFIKKLITKIKE
jgi:hypothetical protein